MALDVFIEICIQLTKKSGNFVNFNVSIGNYVETIRSVCAFVHVATELFIYLCAKICLLNSNNEIFRSADI